MQLLFVLRYLLLLNIPVGAFHRSSRLISRSIVRLSLPLRMASGARSGGGVATKLDRKTGIKYYECIVVLGIMTTFFCSPSYANKTYL